MALTLSQLQDRVKRRAKILANDATATAAIVDDLNDAIEIVAAKRAWPQLLKTNTISLTSSDGDISYALASDVDEVEQMRITSPTSYSREVRYLDRNVVRRRTPNKLIPGRTVPTVWYFAEPTIDTNNVETKNVSFEFRPDQAYTITYSYKSFPPVLSSGNLNSQPFFDPTYHHILVDYAVWKYAQRATQANLNPDYYELQWTEGLNMIEKDEQQQVEDLPPIPGPDRTY